MKKFVTLIVFVTLLGLVLPVAYAQGAKTVEISTPEGLAGIADDPNGNYALTADIDMTGFDWEPVAFTGRFDGGGHTIYNLKVTKLGRDHAVTVDGNHKTYDTYFSGLFSVVRGASIKNLNLLNEVVHVTTDKDCFAAGLAGFAEDTAISGCSVSGRVYLYQTRKMCGVAGVVGFGYGTISNCSANVELVFVDGDKKIKCEEFLGGILACGYSDIENCTVKLKGYASVQGYVHNGGIVGMHHIHTADRSHGGYVRGNTVDAAIFFYENNRDRRAYCKAYIGEPLNKFVKVSGNKTVYFKNGETRKYDTVLLPEKCAEPEYAEAVTAPTCTEFGYTTYTCKTCGYSYTDDYTAPRHTPGDWVTSKEPTAAETGVKQLKCALCGKVLDEQVIPVLHTHVAGDWVAEKEPTYQEGGIKRQYCKDCGELIKEEAIPKLVYVSSCKPDRTELALNVGATAPLSAKVLPADASNIDLKWTSSNENVATVDAQGNVHAAAPGTAVITVVSADGNASGACAVTVTYTAWQWIVEYILFGWLWN